MEKNQHMLMKDGENEDAEINKAMENEATAENKDGKLVENQDSATHKDGEMEDEEVIEGEISQSSLSV